MLDHLKPISGNHSIGRVVATFYIAQEILKLESFFNDFKVEESFKKYQRRSLLRSKKIVIDKPNFGLNNNTGQDEVVGFTFEEFNEQGKLKNILVIQNEPEYNRATISFETRIYTRWAAFFDNFRNDLSIFFEKRELYIRALKLNYIDEFAWAQQDRIPVDDIFNEASELINKKFLNSENGTILMLSQNKELNIEERTEVSFNNSIKRIVINHLYVIAFQQIFSNKEVLEKNLMYDRFNSAHESNKEMLKDLLSHDVRKAIGLN